MSYCSRACQRAARPAHREFCRAAAGWLASVEAQGWEPLAPGTPEEIAHALAIGAYGPDCGPLLGVTYYRFRRPDGCEGLLRYHMHQPGAPACPGVPHVETTRVGTATVTAMPLIPRS